MNMNTETITKNNSLKKLFLNAADGMVVLPLKKWRAIEEDLENLEMYRSVNFANEIAKRRKETRTTPLSRVLKKYKI